MGRTMASRRRSLLAGAVLILVLAFLAVVLPADAARSGFSPARVEASAPKSRPSDGPVYKIALPYEDPPPVPSGPHRAQFTANCRLCHSPRLVLTQPRLTEKQWNAVVHKMVVVYGATLPPEQERDIVAYLTAVRGR